MEIMEIEGKQLRIIQDDGIIWFVLSDIMRILGLKNAKDRCVQLGLLYEKRPVHTNGGTQCVLVVKYADVCQIVLRSWKTSADRKSAILNAISAKIGAPVMYTHERMETKFIRMLGDVLSAMGIVWVPQYQVGPYRLDCYIPKYNIAIEYDEEGHLYYDSNTERSRTSFIETAIGCNFIRVSDSTPDSTNVGYVLKNILALSGDA